MAFLFGKLPTHGDFLSRGLDDVATGALDDFLSASLSQAATLEDFDDLYPSAPAWRFLIELDGKTVCGLIAPSVDKVGRQFPIVVGVAYGGSPGLLIDACEAYLYQAFAEGLTADALFDNLSAVPAAPADEAPLIGWFLEDEDKVVIDRLDGNFPPRLVTRMMEAARQAQ